MQQPQAQVSERAADLGEEHILLAKELGGQGVALRPRAAVIQLVHHRRPAGVPQQLRDLALDQAQEPCGGAAASELGCLVMCCPRRGVCGERVPCSTAARRTAPALATSLCSGPGHDLQAPQRGLRLHALP